MRYAVLCYDREDVVESSTPEQDADVVAKLDVVTDVAVAKLRGPAAALELVDALAKDLDGYFYFFGVRGALLMDLDRSVEAREAFDRALAIATSPAEAAHIRLQIDRLTPEVRPMFEPGMGP
jgi:predicted RNA polymerase sigma factor